MKTKVIAIDGPAGSGKSTTAKLVAKKLGFLYLDTGAMYRTLTLKVLDEGINPRSEDEVSKAAETSRIEIKQGNGVNRIFLDGRDVTEKIRDSRIDENVSFVSKYKRVRETLVNLQRKIGENQNVVAEGRDTTTVVFPQAFIKIYLDCDLKERAKRKALEFQGKGITTSINEQKEKLALRDRIDSKRELSPLKKDKDAFIIDTTHLNIEQQVDKVVQIYNESIS
ncbi:MAG: (d)CMP kinase [Candidatus Zixiibacteriota bacterium]